MYQRVWIASLLMISVGCSQRAPYRVVATPGASPGSAERTSASSERRPALSAIAATGASNATGAVHTGALVFPVPSVASSRFADSFDAPRGRGRRHNAIDILAPRGSAVIAVADGRVLRLSHSSSGGISLYAADAEERFVYYYAHLEAYHPGMHAGRPLTRGDTIGYVGTTGNAPKDTPHLHFQLMRMPPDRRYWEGEPINPYLLLRDAAAAAVPVER